MVRHIGTSSAFYLFASEASLKSKWVNFEIEHARIQTITNDNYPLRVFAIDDVPLHSLPQWMRRNYVDGVKRNPNDVARFIEKDILNLLETGNASIDTCVGRGGLLDQARSLVNRVIVDSQTTPNVFILAGIPRIGRTTFGRYLLREMFPSLPNLHRGPTIDLPIRSELADIYKAIVSTSGILAETSVQEELSLFTDLPYERKLERVVGTLGHFSSLGEAILIRNPSGLFDNRRRLYYWWNDIFTLCAKDRNIKLLIASNRMIDPVQEIQHTNIVQIRVERLSDSAIQDLFVSTLVALGGAAMRLPVQTLVAIGGHPLIAGQVARAVSRLGASAFSSQSPHIAGLQDNLLRESISREVLSEIEISILTLLCWITSLPSHIVQKVVCDFHGIDVKLFSMDSLVMSCVVDVSGPNYSIADPIRTVFRRAYGYGSEELLKQLRLAIENEIDLNDELSWERSNLIDAAIYALAEAGRSLPGAWKGWLTAGFVERLIGTFYRSGRENPLLLQRVVKLAEWAEQIPMEAATHEQIQAYAIQAELRLDNYSRADEMIAAMETSRLDSRFYLRGYWFKRQNRIEEAIAAYERAVDLRVFKNASVNQLAICYYLHGQDDKLEALVANLGDRAMNSPVLIDTKIFRAIGKKDFKEAERLISELSRHGDVSGRVARARAQLIVRRDGDRHRAIAVLDEHLTNNRDDIYTVGLRGRLYAEIREFEKAKEDLSSLVRSEQASRSDQAYLASWIAFSEGDWRTALALAERMHKASKTYLAHRRRILDLARKDSSLALTDVNLMNQDLEKINTELYKRYRDNDALDEFFDSE